MSITIRAFMPILLMMLTAQQVIGSPISYNKIFYLEGADLDAPIFAGALVQTWAGKTIFEAEHNIFPHLGTKAKYLHATQRIKFEAIHAGFPMQKTQEFVSDGYKKSITVKDDHNLPNSGSAEIHIPKGVNDYEVEVWDPVTRKNVKQPLKKAAAVYLAGRADPGKPTGKNEDHLHSVDSFASAYIDKAKILEWTADKDGHWKLVGRNSMTGGVQSEKGGVVDPYFVTVTDLNTGEVTTMMAMTQTLDFVDALFSVDDTGIRFSIDRNNPDSVVSYSFSSEFDLVSNPYSYGVRLDPTGLSVSGDRFPLSDWQITMTDDRIEVVFPFDLDGLAYDMADLDLSSLFTPGHSYSLGAGSVDGAYEIMAPDAESVPEPSTLALSVLGLLGLMFRRRPVITRQKMLMKCVGTSSVLQG